MRIKNKIKSARVITGVPIPVFTVLLALTAGIAPVNASDHMDSPFLAQTGPPERTMWDIGDHFAFKGKHGLVFAMSLNPYSPPGAQSPLLVLDPNCTYEFKIDSDNDFKADIAYKISVGKPDADGIQDVILRKATGDAAENNGPTGDIIVKGKSSRGNATDVIETADGIRLFVGARQDPFFYDYRLLRYNIAADQLGNSLLPLYGDFFAKPSDAPIRSLDPKYVDTDGFTFGLQNVSLIAVEIPGMDGKFNTWSVTYVQGEGLNEQVDRTGRPGISAYFLPDPPFEDYKQPFNTIPPSEDGEPWVTRFNQTITGWQELWERDQKTGLPKMDANNNPIPRNLAEHYLPEVLPVDTSKPTEYPNGRGFKDDAIYTMLQDFAPFQETAFPQQQSNLNWLDDFPYAPLGLTTATAKKTRDHYEAQSNALFCDKAKRDVARYCSAGVSTSVLPVQHSASDNNEIQTLQTDAAEDTGISKLVLGMLIGGGLGFFAGRKGNTRSH